MKVILTHEQSDFDAVAALLAAWLLDDTAKPVLAARLNRNVRHFINLYGAELPFIESRDLVNANIDTVTLVDTQSLVTLKGITQKTKIRVVDHHPLRDALPAEWQCEIDRTGSCTTLLVEKLQDHLTSLSMIQATLLLLGIYEDTGSMTYASTTARDIRACASLVEVGGNLRIVADYLNPALTDAQKQLTDRLLATAQTHLINGKAVMIAAADARDMREEISSVAHKLRDLLDPDGLFILVNTSEGIRLVARSTSDQVNVAKVAAHFGGGGHDRAASALIDPRKMPLDAGEITLDTLSEKLLKILQEEILVPITVGKIMSKHPLLLTPETSLYEAERVMQRYGYEGFPVVDHGKVVGLLTRRAVDRAAAHHLNLTAGSLMEAGNYALNPTDTIDRLQTMMSTTGWGQLPVIDPNTQKVVGIVTRTDFLKTLTRENNFVPGKLNYAATLQSIMPALRLTLIKKVAEEAAAEQYPVYIVGGFVRDLILNRPSIDFDIVVEGDAVRLANRLVQRYGGKITSHHRFGTAKWQIKGIKAGLAAAFDFSPEQANQLPDSLDLISARTEFYDHPTALPTVERSSIKLDLHRRDFTINTMALRLDGRHFGELYDYWDGYSDLQKRQIKVLHSLSFIDDPTRLIRAARFEQRFAFTIENRTLQLMSEARPLIKQVSGDRLRHEFDLIFREDAPLPILQRMEELDLMTAIHPALHLQEEDIQPIHAALSSPIPEKWRLPGLVDHLPLRQTLAYLVWLTPLCEEKAVEIANRFHLSNSLIQALQHCCRIWSENKNWTNLCDSEFFDRVSSAPAVSGYAVYLLSEDRSFKDRLEKAFTQWQYLIPGVDGNKLKQIGLPPGPRYGQIIHDVRAAWIDGNITNQDQEDVFLQELIRS